MASPGTIYAYVPGLRGTKESWQPLVERLERDLRGEWIPLEHHCGPFSRRSPEQVARSLSATLDQICTERGPKAELVLIGHSIGGVLVRAAYLMAAGQLGEDKTRYSYTWPDRVSRIVLMGSIDRGVDPEGSWRARLGAPLARFLRPFGIRFVYDILKGSSFITNLRISWIRYYRNLPNPPCIVQVLGTEDDEVQRRDSLDPDLFPHATAIDVPDANHVRLHDLESTPNPDLHYARLRHAIADPFPRHPVAPQVMEKRHVILLLHGIRASAWGWPKRLAEEIRKRDPNAIIKTPDYGYFSARRFAIPYLHRKPLRWFQDQYSQALAEYPEAEFSFVGHSNGTYLMAQSLREIGGIYFRRIFLGGCVLSPRYAWPSRPEPYTVHNAFCHSDLVVGILCSALAGMGRRDVGTAGFESFRDFPGQQNLAVAGHGAAFDTRTDLAAVADFILGGDPPTGILKEPPVWTRRLSRISVVLGWLVLLLLAAIPILGFRFHFLPIALLADVIIVGLLLIFLELL